MANDVQHPDHYTWKGTECKTIIESMTKGLDGQDAYYVGNIIKYLYRYPAKGTAIKDLMKARQYLDFIITNEEVKEDEIIENPEQHLIDLLLRTFGEKE